jgi:hypothetical protein
MAHVLLVDHRSGTWRRCIGQNGYSGIGDLPSHVPFCLIIPGDDVDSRQLLTAVPLAIEFAALAKQSNSTEQIRS